MDVGTVAEWVGSVASIAAAVVSVFALVVAMRANSHAKDANQTSQETLDTSLQARYDALEQAEQRRQLEAAGDLQAWWAATRDGKRWAVQIVNGARGAGVFRDVVLVARNPKGTVSVPIPMLPPGKYVLEPEANGQGIPRPIDEQELWDPLTRSSKHAVVSLEFTDPVGERWRWDAHGGLRQLEDSLTESDAP